MAVDENRSGLRGIFDRIPARLILVMMVFFSNFFLLMMRVNMSINILAMVQQTDVNGTQIEMPDYGPRYSWTAYEQSILLGAYFWGYAITSIPAGILSEKYGGKNVILYSFVICAGLTALSPVLAFNFWISYVLRFLIGSFSGAVLPAIYKLISKWAPPDEKGKFTAAIFGSAIGTVVTWALAGILIETVGWDFAFYVPGILVILFSLVWLFVVYDSPATHPRIMVQEKDYIESRLVGITNTKTWPPLLQMLLSVSFWALFLLHYGSNWGLYFLITAAPRYMSEVLKFNLSTAGILASLPYLARFFAGMVFASISDLMKRRQTLNVTYVRKIFCIFSHIIPGLFLIGMTYVGDQPYVCVTFITLSLGFNGASAVTNLQNAHDLTPNYAASTYSIINAAGTTTGFISPLIVAYFTQERSTSEEWNKVFWIGAVAYIVPAILFMIFGSGQIQKWNERPVTRQEETPAGNDNKKVDIKI